MAVLKSGEPNGDDAEQPAGSGMVSDHGGEMEERLARIEIPTGPRLPPPPDIQFQRPTLGRSSSRAFGDSQDSNGQSQHEIAASGEGGGRSHIGASLVIGITFPSCVIVGASIGLWIDGHWHSSPWGTVVMSLAGIAAGFLNIFRVVAMIDRDKKPKKK